MCRGEYVDTTTGDVGVPRVQGKLRPVVEHLVSEGLKAVFSDREGCFVILSEDICSLFQQNIVSTKEHCFNKRKGHKTAAISVDIARRLEFDFFGFGCEKSKKQ